MTLKILLGDDQDAFPVEKAEILSECKPITEKYGLKFDFAHNEKWFRQYLQEKKYDVIITDLNWTNEDSGIEYKTGYRLLDACKELAPVRILRSSDVNKPEVREKAFYHGATDVMSKAEHFPVELEKVIVKYGLLKNG